MLERYYQRSFKGLSDLIKDGKKQGVFQVDSPAFAATQIIALIDGIKVQLHLFGPKTDLGRMKKATKRFILNALGAREEGE